jgi:NNP family nitrate/nitrite transporter-like MFS transporter
MQGAFWVFAAFYGACVLVTWFVFLRRSFLVARLPSLATARI